MAWSLAPHPFAYCAKGWGTTQVLADNYLSSAHNKGMNKNRSRGPIVFSLHSMRALRPPISAFGKNICKKTGLPPPPFHIYFDPQIRADYFIDSIRPRRFTSHNSFFMRILTRPCLLIRLGRKQPARTEKRYRPADLKTCSLDDLQTQQSGG